MIFNFWIILATFFLEISELGFSMMYGFPEDVQMCVLLEFAFLKSISCMLCHSRDPNSSFGEEVV